MEDAKSVIDDLLPPNTGRWNVVANITKEKRRGPIVGQEYLGTKVFAPGAKVYVAKPMYGGCDSVGVVGQNRKTKHLSFCIVSIGVIENFRSKFLYKPSVISALTKNYPNSLNQGLVSDNALALGEDCLFPSKGKSDELLHMLEIWKTLH
ncbi:MAG: hypothetical protein ABJ275_08205 [Maricaulaceae bacterium]